MPRGEIPSSWRTTIRERGAAMNEIKPGQRWRARFDTTVLTVIQRAADDQQWLAQNDADCLQEWYYTTQILDDFVLVVDGYYSLPAS